MANRSKSGLYISIALVIALVVVYSNSQPHGHVHSHGGHGHSHGGAGGAGGHVHSHGHAHDDHGHAHNENPAYKYSRAANEPQQAEQHGHSHDDHDHGHHHSHGANGGGVHHHGHSHGQQQQQQKRAAESTQSTNTQKQVSGRDRFTIALHAMSSTALISIAPFLILFFIPLNDNNIENQALLKVLLAFASGSLLGDAFLHLIPHSLDPHDHSSSHSHSHSHHGHGDDHHDHSQQTNVGLWVMSGILTFLLVEKFIVSVKGEHSHSHEKEKIGADKKNEDKSDEDEDEDEDEKKPKKSSSSKKEKDKPKKKDEDKDKKKKPDEHKHEGIKVAGYLNLAADFAHNFTDGLAIGASFLAGQNLGIITTFTILFHEVPHEIGDFAILIQSGCSKKKAIFLQLVTALGACSGTLLSLVFESAISGFATSCILPFTAGGFIYIATVTIIPELKESTGLIQSIKEIIALVAGVGMMIVISYME